MKKSALTKAMGRSTETQRVKHVEFQAEIQRVKLAFVKRLNQAMDAAGWPSKHHGRQAHAAEQFSVTPAAVNRWLSGQQYPNRNSYGRIARILGVRVEWLFFDLGAMGPFHQDLLPDGSGIAEPPQRLIAVRNYGVDYPLLKIILTALRRVHQQYPLSGSQHDALVAELYAAISRNSTPDPTDADT